MNLMIDDWVFYEGKPIKVENVHKDCINFEPDIPYVQEEFWINFTELAYIPFTPEIMEKNGFKLNEKECELHKACGIKKLAYDFPEPLEVKGYYIEYNTEKKVAYLTDHGLIPIRYVNEFQQLLRLMSTKIEQAKQILDNFVV